ncbi:hypothetical protein [Sphingopyxis sp. NJF-3]
MESVIYWIGVAHVATYSIAAMIIVTGWFSEWLIRRLRLKRELILAYQRLLKDRHDAKENAS